MDISTLYRAAELKDNGGGQQIEGEIEPTKEIRALANVEPAGISDMVDIREGDALQTLSNVGGEVDLLLLDGDLSLHLPTFRLVEARLKTGALVCAENALDAEFLAYVHDRGSELAVVTR